MDFSHFTTITFDCYGTLIDWEAGILPALRGVLAAHGQTLPDAATSSSMANLKREARAALTKAIEMFWNRLSSNSESAAVLIPVLPSCVACTSRSPRGRHSRTRSAVCKNFSGTFAWL